MARTARTEPQSSNPRSRAPLIETRVGERGVARSDLSGGDLARLLRVDLKTIHNWVNQGHVLARRTEGRHLRFQRVDIARFLRRSGDPVPAALGAPPPRVLVHRGRAVKRAAADAHSEASSLFSTVIEAVTGDYEVVVFALDAMDAEMSGGLIRALRARPDTRGLAIVGVSRARDRRMRFMADGGDMALEAQTPATVARSAAWLVGGAVAPPRGALISVPA